MVAWETKFCFWWPKRKSGGQRDHQHNWGWWPEILDNFPSKRAKYWTWRLKSLKEYLFLLFYLKIPLWGLQHIWVTYTWGRIYLISNINILSFFRSTQSIGPQRKVNLPIMVPLRWPYRVSRRNSCGQRG